VRDRAGVAEDSEKRRRQYMPIQAVGDGVRLGAPGQRSSATQEWTQNTLRRGMAADDRARFPVGNWRLRCCERSRATPVAGSATTQLVPTFSSRSHAREPSCSARVTLEVDLLLGPALRKIGHGGRASTVIDRNTGSQAVDPRNRYRYLLPIVPLVPLRRAGRSATHRSRTSRRTI